MGRKGEMENRESEGTVYDRGPHAIPPVAPPLPIFLTEEEEALPVNRIGQLKSNRVRTGVVKHKEANTYVSKSPKTTKISRTAKAVVPVEVGGRQLKVPVDVGRVNGNVKVIGKRDPETVVREELIEVLERNDGYLTYAALELGITYHRIRKMVDEDEEIGKMVKEMRERDLDDGENALMTMVKGSGRDKLGSTIFLLKCRAKDRGYVEGESKKIEAGNVQINLVNFREEDVKADVRIGEMGEDMPEVPGA